MTNDPSPQIQPTFRVENTGHLVVALASVKISYWFTDEGVTPLYFCNYSTLPGNCDLVRGNLSPAWGPYANRVLDITFAGDQLDPGEAVNVEVRIHRSDWGDTVQSNDYSFAPEFKDFGYSRKSVLHHEGHLVSGQPP